MVDKLPRRVTGVGRDTLNEAIKAALVDHVTAVVGGGLLKDSLVEDGLSRYVVVNGILEAK